MNKSIGVTLGGLAFIGGSILLFKKLQKDSETKYRPPISSNSETKYRPPISSNSETSPPDANPYNQLIPDEHKNHPHGVWIGGRKTKNIRKEYECYK
jgi:hypothetical protein